MFLKARREGRKRGRALLDFEQQEEDELGFRKNDLITIVSEKDEHCWVGELGGKRGWFPAKFVEVFNFFLNLNLLFVKYIIIRIYIIR